MKAINRVAEHFGTPPTLAICDRTIANRIAANLKLHNAADPIGHQIVAIPITVAEWDFVHTECRELRGAKGRIPFVATLRLFESQMLPDGPTRHYAIYEVSDE
jgi:hypothetical protein